MIKFGTGGFRGIIGEDFVKSNIDKIAKSLCDYIITNNKIQEVIIGYDRRFLSEESAKWMATTIAKNGMKVILSDCPTPSPTIMSIVQSRGCDFGVMITASHNPYFYNGVKMFLTGGVDADVEFTKELEDLSNNCDYIETEKFAQEKEHGNIIVQDFMDEYLDNIKKFIDPGIKDNSLKILFNNLNGVGIVGLKQLFEDFNIMKYDIVNEEHDAFFSKNSPNPTEGLMKNDAHRVVLEHYDFALGTDSDADRLGVVDNLGNYISNNEILAAIYYYLIQYKKESGDIVKNCATSILVDKVANRLGYQCHEVDVGFKNISSKMLEVDALIGGESSGGLTLRNYVMGKDSVFSSSLFIEMVVMMKLPVSEIIDKVKKFAGYSHILIEEEYDLPEELDIFDVEFDFPFPVKEVSRFNNNKKFYFDGDSWLLLRKSGTEAKLRVFVEMKNEEYCEKIISIVLSKLSVR